MAAVDWVNPRLLSGEIPIRALSAAQGAPRLFVIDDLLLPNRLETLRGLYRDSEAWSEMFSLFRVRGKEMTSARATREQWDAAPQAERFYAFRQYAGGAGALTVARAQLLGFNLVLTHDDLLALLGAATGVVLEPNVETAALSLGPGHFQRPHNDVAAGRLLCGALYLSDGWKPEFGGLFEMAAQDRVFFEVEPRANRLVLFDPNEQTGAELGKPEIPMHQVRPVTAAAGAWRRHSLSIWWKRV